jgi:hypothetical protein
VLVALAVDGLLEVALAIEEPDRDERQRHVARGLAVVAREDAEAAGIDRQRLVEAELGAEVRDELAFLHRRNAGALAHAVIAVVHRQHAVVVVQERRVVRGLLEPALVHAAQDRLRIVADRLPQHGIEAREELARRPVPAEPEVVGELLETS